ncbi:MAG: NAD(P)/FAD-dependent oxidoreductase [Vicinamibacterales bacterium]
MAAARAALHAASQLGVACLKDTTHISPSPGQRREFLMRELGARSRCDHAGFHQLERAIVPDEARWSRDFYPAMVHRLPALAKVTDVTSWAGSCEMAPGYNPVLGFHPSLDGLIFANEFSGHGLMMSLATGKIVSELVRLGRSELFDIAIFAPDRFERGALVHDAATS